MLMSPACHAELLETPRAAGWEALAKKHLEENPLCVYTGDKAHVVHHKFPRSKFPKLELCPLNLRSIRDQSIHLAEPHQGDFDSYDPHMDYNATKYKASYQRRPLTAEQYEAEAEEMYRQWKQEEKK